jgi:hypothetical protein
MRHAHVSFELSDQFFERERYQFAENVAVSGLKRFASLLPAEPSGKSLVVVHATIVVTGRSKIDQASQVATDTGQGSPLKIDSSVLRGDKLDRIAHSVLTSKRYFR